VLVFCYRNAPAVTVWRRRCPCDRCAPRDPDIVDSTRSGRQSGPEDDPAG